jgi:thiol:disulfide interchange protein
VLAITVLGYAAVRFIVSLMLPPTQHWQLHLVVEIVFTLVWYGMLLRTVGKSERFLQTATAIFGFSLLLSPPWIAAIHYSQVLPEQHPLYAPVAILALAIIIWIIRAGSYILKAALELPIAACVLLTILQILTGDLLLQAVTPGEPAAVEQATQPAPTT